MAKASLRKGIIFKETVLDMPCVEGTTDIWSNVNVDRVL
jgi:hypothetical protein